MIHIQDLGFRIGSFALQEICLQIQRGEYFVLLGATGSGKTLLLECLCGLNRIDSGAVHIDGIDVTELEPRLRRIGYVPQDFALFPHKTVWGNVSFGLQDTATLRVEELLNMVGIAHLAARFPVGLSGGEKQRVALARALAVEPGVLLLDEPVSAVDEHTRDSLCRQLKNLQQATRTTTIHVCHNFVEMLSVADRVGIIDEGRILQVGTPQEVLERPVSDRVARFMQAGNLFPAQVIGGGDRLRLVIDPDGAARQVEVPGPVPEALRPLDDAGDEVVVMIRPEKIQIAATAPSGARGASGPDAAAPVVFQGVLDDLVDLGAVVRLTVQCGRLSLLVVSGKREYEQQNIQRSDAVWLTIAPEDIHVMRE
jgi:molybdate transport system ATP-binding protein/molybdate/tungstate transport system ATP-binding protein